MKKDKALAYILLILGFVLIAGLHRFYLGKWGTGILWLLTAGIFGFGTIIDLFLTSRMVDRYNRRVGG
ncbi:MAG: TM2 domain-containing protein [Planctomycetota bacterium]